MHPKKYIKKVPPQEEVNPAFNSTSYIIPKCRSYLVTPSSARWVSSLCFLPSTWKRLDIQAQNIGFP